MNGLGGDGTEFPFLKFLGPEKISKFGIFFFCCCCSLYLHSYIGRDSMLSTKFTYISLTPGMEGLKGIRCNIFLNFIPETGFNGLEFSTCPIMLPFRTFQVLEHFVFKCTDFVFLN